MAINIEKAIKRYNEVMHLIGCEHLTIGEELSEGTANWNLRDMVAECDYQLMTFYEEGHPNYNLVNNDILEWLTETDQLFAFIRTYMNSIVHQKCTQNHCSKYDNA